MRLNVFGGVLTIIDTFSRYSPVLEPKDNPLFTQDKP
jgi:hypothetical protein